MWCRTYEQLIAAPELLPAAAEVLAKLWDGQTPEQVAEYMRVSVLAPLVLAHDHHQQHCACMVVGYGHGSRGSQQPCTAQVLAAATGHLGWMIL